MSSVTNPTKQWVIDAASSIINTVIVKLCTYCEKIERR